MALQDKAANAAKVLKGKAKEAAGKITGDPKLEADGKLDQGIGHLKQSVEKVKDTGKDILDR